MQAGSGRKPIALEISSQVSHRAYRFFLYFSNLTVASVYKIGFIVAVYCIAVEKGNIAVIRIYKSFNGLSYQFVIHGCMWVF